MWPDSKVVNPTPRHLAIVRGEPARYEPSAIVRPRNDLSDRQVHMICDVIRETGFSIHQYFGPGFRERVYERSLTHRLRKCGLDVRVQPRVKVLDHDGTELTEEVLDLIVEEVLVLELKAIRQTTDTDIAQILGYLRATEFRHGLLINFGSPKFFIKKYVY